MKTVQEKKYDEGEYESLPTEPSWAQGLCPRGL